MIKELIGEDDPYLREIPEEYDFGKSLEYEPEELKNILIENMKHYILIFVLPCTKYFYSYRGWGERYGGNL